MQSKKGFAFGIDLGTTNSCIAVLGGDNIPEIITLSNGKRTMQSCVWYKKDGIVVGEDAYNNRYKRNAVYSVKRKMGSSEKISLEVGGEERMLSPEEVSAEILKELCKQVPGRFGKVKDVVITVPAYFNNMQVEATKKAAMMADLNLLGISREPTAAALAYTFLENQKDKNTILVLDLGGGTFDVSLVRMQPKSVKEDLSLAKEVYGEDFGSDSEENEEDSSDFIIRVLKNDGDTMLGGDDIDKGLARIILERYDIDPIVEEKHNKVVFEKFVLDLEVIKKSGYFTYSRPYTTVEGVSVNLVVVDEDYLRSVQLVYNKVKAIVDRCVSRDDLKLLDQIVLVGGSTKNELFKDLIKKDYPGITINDSLNPDESVALGASVQANYLQYGDIKLNLTEILPISVGFKADGKVKKMIRANTTVPCQVVQLFATDEDMQETLSVDVYQGESVSMAGCVYLGSLVFEEIPKKPRGEVGIRVALEVDLDGFLTCSASVDNGPIKTVKLQNLFAQENVSVESVAVDKRIIRWKEVAKENGDQVLYKMVEKFEQGSIKPDEIINYLKNNRSKKLDTIK